MVETWRKGRVFRASAKKPPLRGDRGDVEKGDEEKKKWWPVAAQKRVSTVGGVADETLLPGITEAS